MTFFVMIVELRRLLFLHLFHHSEIDVLDDVDLKSQYIAITNKSTCVLDFLK